MAFSYGNIAVLELDNASGTITDVSAYVSSVGLTIDRDTTDLPRLGGNQVAKLVGPPGSEFSVEGWYDPTIDTILGVWQLEANQTARTIFYGPAGSATSAIKYSGEVFLSTYDPDTSASDAASWSATFLVDTSGLTRGTFA